MPKRNICTSTTSYRSRHKEGIFFYFVSNTHTYRNKSVNQQITDRHIYYRKQSCETFTNSIRYFCGKCDYNLIQYQFFYKCASMKQKFYVICMERNAYYKHVLIRTKCQYFYHSQRAPDTILDDIGGYSSTRDG